MTAGIHTVAVEYFEQGGEEVLQVDFEGPGQSQMPLASLIVATKSSGTATPPEVFKVDPALAAKGKEHFAALGCASCHNLKIGGQLVTSTKTAPALPSLNGKVGCFDGLPSNPPRYALSPRNKETLTAAITAAKLPTPPCRPNMSS